MPGLADADSITVHSESHSDATGDLLFWRDLRGSGPEAARQAPNRLESDIQWIRTVNGPNATRLRVHFRELRRIGAVPLRFMTFAVQRGDGTVVNGTITINTVDDVTNWAGAMGPTVPSGVTHRIDYDTNDLFITIPANILGRYPKVRSSFRVVTSDVTGYDPYWIDDARTGYVRTNTATEGYGRYGPWIR